MALEFPKQEYRQVKVSGDPFMGEPAVRHYRMQQKWLLQNGSPYCPIDFGPPDNPEDVFMGIIDGRPMWQPMKTVWRDLVTVTEAEARADSQ